MRRILALIVFLATCAPTAALATEGGLISLDWSLLIQAFNFLLLLFLLSKLLYKPLLAKIQAAHAEAQQIRAEALKDAADEQRRLVEAAKAEAARLVTSARQEMDQDVRRARQELRQEVADLAIAAAERLIKKSLNDADHRRIVDAIGRMGQKN